MDKKYNFSPTIERFSGFASQYDKYRPGPPNALFEVLVQLAKTEKPNKVVDLGCGTGLSTRPWGSFAEQVIGIDPSNDMLKEAKNKTLESNIIYQNGFGHATGLPNDCTDIVTCASSLHWMEPKPTLTEVRRIMRTGGVFAAYGYQYPLPNFSWEVELAYREFRKSLDNIETKHQKDKGLKRWPWNDVFNTMQQSGMFRYTKTIQLHTIHQWSANHFIGWVKAHGGVQFLIQNNIPTSSIGIDKLIEIVKNSFGNTNTPKPCLFSYQVQIGIV